MSLADADAAGVLVKPEVARKQLDEETAQPLDDGGTREDGSPDEVGPDSTTDGGDTGRREPGTEPRQPEQPRPKRFHATVTLDTTRVGRDAARIAEEVIAHPSGLVGVKVTVTLEINAEIPSGALDQIVRVVTENSQVLKFTSHGFEEE